MGKWIGGALVCAVAVIIACSGDKAATENECQPKVFGVIVYQPGIDLQVRDPFGRGQAIGTTAVFHGSDGSTDEAFTRDTLHIVGVSNLTGTFTATLTRPYYRDATITNIRVTPNGCAVNTAIVPVTLELAPGAPPLRALVLLGADFLSQPGVQAHLVPHFDADPTVSTALTWQVSDATLASVDANGVVTAKCSKSGGTVKVTATAVFDGTTSASVNLGVAPAASCP